MSLSDLPSLGILEYQYFSEGNFALFNRIILRLYKANILYRVTSRQKPEDS